MKNILIRLIRKPCGTRLAVRVSRLMAHGSRLLALGSWLIALGAWHMALGSWNLYAASSTNYALSSDGFSGGGAASVASASYEINNSAIGYVANTAMSSTNYQSQGAIAISEQSNMPTISSIAPANYQFHFDNASPSYTVTATDADADTLNYEARMDGTLKDGPQTTNPLTWGLTPNNLGRRELEFKVVDSDGNVVQNQSAYVLREPVK